MTVASLERRLAEAARSGRRWLAPGALSILDQGLVSGANFALVVLFARWLAPTDYGAVAIGLSVFLLAANFHHALLLEPMSVMGPRQFAQRMGGYFSAMLGAHAGAVAALGALLAAAAALWRTSAPSLAAALAALSLTTPAVLSFWVLRRICYVTADPATALRGGLTFMSCALAGAAAARALSWRSSAALFLITGASALCACAVLLPLLRRRLSDGTPPASVLREALAAHWNYGRWMVGVSLTYWLANSAFPVLLAAGAGLAASAELRAIENLTSPVLQATGALSLLLLPWVAGQTQAEGTAYLQRFQRRAMGTALAITGSYLGCVLLFSRTLMRLLYGPGAYAGLAVLVPLVAAATLVRGVSELSFSTALKGAARPDAHFLATLVSSVFVLTGGWLLVERWRVAGAAAGMLASNILQAAVLGACFLRLTRGGRGNRDGGERA